MKTLKELKNFIILWLTQSFSALGSSMTSFALVIWLYSDSGSALTTSLLTVCSYAPYVLMSIFAGAVSDKWNKKAIMLICDSFAAVCTVIILILLKTGSLAVWHLYILNALNGLMNSIQSPASDVAVTLLTPEKHYQKTSGMRSFSNSLVSILTPVLAAAVMSFAGIEAVIAFDLTTFAAAFLVLMFFIRIPQVARDSDSKETIFQSAKSGLSYLKGNQGILWLILFFIGDQPDSINVQCGTSCAYYFKSRRDGIRYRKQLCRRGNTYRKRCGNRISKAKEQDQCYLQLPAYLHEHGKFPACFRR